MITSPDNPKVKQARSLLEPRGRERQGQCLIEGVRLIEDAMRAGTVPALIFFVDAVRAQARAQRVLDAAAARGAVLIEVSAKVLGTLTDTVTSQGVIAEVAIPRLAPPPRPDFILLLDQLRDPGNLGTALRSAEAAGVPLIALAPGSVDPWNAKVIRSAMGAHFRVPLLTMTDWEAVERLLAGRPVWLAEAAGATTYDEVDWTQSCALVVGGEAEGISARARRLGTGKVSIPMAAGAESLNAAMATTLLVFEVARQRRNQRTRPGPGSPTELPGR